MFSRFYYPLVVLVWLGAFGKVTVGRSHRKTLHTYIGGGVEANPDEFAHLGVIVRNGYIVCAGSVITENLVLTAAHCLYNPPTSEVLRPYQIRFLHGNFTRDVTGKKIISARHNFAIFYLIPHPEFNYSTSHNDIGLIVLETRLHFPTTHRDISPVALYKKDFHTVGLECEIAGWGLVNQSSFARTLRKTKVTVEQNSNCLQKERMYVPAKMLCAVCENRSHILSGDSGTSLVCPAQFNSRVVAQLGVASLTNPKTYTGFFTRVPYYIPWIQQHAAQQRSRRGLMLVDYRLKSKHQCCVQ